MEETSAGHFIQNRFHHPATFLPLTAGAQNIRLLPRHTAPPGAVCAGRHSHCFESGDLSSERIYTGHILCLFAQNVWRNALHNFVKSYSRPYVCTTQADSHLLNGESARKCRIGLLGSDAIYNPQTYFRQKLRLFYKMTYFKLYVKAYERFSHAFVTYLLLGTC